MRRKVVRDAAQALSVRTTIEKSKKKLPPLKVSKAVLSGTSIDATRLPSTRPVRPRRVLWKLEPRSKCSAGQDDLIPMSKAERNESNTVIFRRRGLIFWRDWDGMPWHTTSLPFHRLSNLSNFTSRAMEELTKHEKLLAIGPPTRFINHFWVLHHRAMLRARRCEEYLTLHLTDTAIIIFLLRTAPKSITQRMQSSLHALELNSFGLDTLTTSWAPLRKIIGHQHNPLYFTAAVFREQLFNEFTAKKIKDKVNAKAYRMEIKSSFGSRPFGKLSGNELKRTRMDNLFRPKNETEKFEAFFAALPLRWTIEPLISNVRVSFIRLNILSNRVSQLMDNASSRCLKRISRRVWDFRQRPSMISSGIKSTTTELLYLADEFAALRYYRYQTFPNSYTQEEIAVGRSLWQLLHSKHRFGRSIPLPVRTSSTPVAVFKSPQASGSQMALKRTVLCSPTSRTFPNDGLPSSKASAPTRGAHDSERDAAINQEKITSLSKNVLGLISWNQWDAQMWKTDKTDHNRFQPLVTMEGIKRQALDDLEARLVGFQPREVDSFLLAHHRAEWMVYARLLPVTNLMTDTLLIDVLIRTAPKNISTRLAPASRVLTTLSYHLRIDLYALHGIQLALAELPHNPLSFETRAVKHALSEDLKDAESGKINSVSERPRLKAWLSPEVQSVHLDDLEVRGQLHRIKYRLSFPEPLLEGIAALIRCYATILQLTSRRVPLFLRRLTFERGQALSRTIEDGHNCIAMTRELGQNLTALRYFRAHRFPDSVSSVELEQSHALAAILDRDTIRETERQKQKRKADAVRRRRANNLASGVDSKETSHATRETSPRAHTLSTGNTTKCTNTIGGSIMPPRTSSQENENQSSGILLPRTASPSDTDFRTSDLPASEQTQKKWRMVSTFAKFQSFNGKFKTLSPHLKAGGKSPKNPLKIRKTFAN
ncbi:hypothetical protein FB567DRAFT_127329 [Paraphoma chrysanthemicola]|uniref:Uncharacterized protein n=1 Tax=Paraphoma chrysanthemicola TaxID=798071 RepID=A0A8K0R130_9PLEO|nr:hypothetical protein FB567DRAFT_127329 [Paraphoma chrysanthemicola]